MRFVMEVNFDSESMKLKPLEELQKILADWSKNIAIYPLEPGAQGDILDAEGEEVGEWAFLDD
ncbi:hypothetical protein CQ010_13005 [Arthrobacter sp. MYb211]|uniref:hypothetical protein n=1 Tax=Micrococcaceae TaxID=1268 RepID=UPI000CFDC432|nr:MULTISPECIES: hypothetical protein [unclassified Arthrobacter]PRA04682.1 hypothetical protein CQ019_10275 [Arthrobacter sp. MYb229]PRC06343.1 hypothetical protein CQ010_13005 [Arthrobacter sp. MYb211]PRA00490.1 hypothetical protein CQ017_05575 [Arthrobacter sp. MYb224]PRA10650.1 hypothetical protein CQ015_12995 [Arthrobacter sp. MYb221]PRB51404.1 hypothetical protein CQ013_06290 [Arthrobacter sp. MYb216]